MGLLNMKINVMLRSVDGQHYLCTFCKSMWLIFLLGLDFSVLSHCNHTPYRIAGFCVDVIFTFSVVGA